MAMMVDRDVYNTGMMLIRICLCVSFIGVVSGDSLPDPSCPGPTGYYAELGCKPVYENSNPTCPIRYNCDHLKNLPADKCVVNGNEYAIGTALGEEDANPCDIGCYCTQGRNGPEFTCAVVDCFHGPTKPGCYLKRNPKSCCPGEEVCPEKEEDRPTCVVDGKIYKDGEYFEVASESEKTCYCTEGYTGENIEPFCVRPKRSYCDVMFRHGGEIRENCVPTYYSSQSPQTGCSVAYRCQNDKDVVIEGTVNPSGEAKSATSGGTVDPGMMCSFGNLTMNVGDELNQATDYSSVCMKCVCEVPPVPTCQRLPDEECDVTSHPAFDNN